MSANSAAVKTVNSKLRGHYSYLNGTLLKDVKKHKNRLTEAMNRGGGLTEFERLESEGQKLTKQKDDVVLHFNHLV